MIDPTFAVAAPAAIVQPSLAGEKVAPSGNSTFADIFSEAVQRVENYRVEADRTVDQFLTGQQEEVHHVAMATQRADLAFDLFLQMKNKAVSAYQEIMRMQL